MAGLPNFRSIRLLLLAGVLALSLWLGGLERSVTKGDRATAVANFPRDQIRAPAAPLPGEAILTGYGTPASTVERDLDAVGHAFENLMLLIKGGEPFRLGANEEFAAALRGKNRAQLRFLPDGHPAFNPSGQIVDRWGTPLFFHVESARQIDIRSAGPDGQMWTEDDIHRHHSGRFRRGRDLPTAEGAKTPG